MKHIQIKSIELTNFKGIRNFVTEFSNESTVISGCNGSGKTTIKDAFFYLLFGTDSENRKDFDLRTIDSNGNVIPELPHEVSALIQIDSEDVSITKRCVEKWVKRRGSNERIFDGLKTEYLVNDVPLKEREYVEYIKSICDIDVLKVLCSHSYFSEQLNMVGRRQFLNSIFGTIDIPSIVTDHSELSCIAADVEKKTADGVRRELQARRKAIIDEQKNIPARIEEVRRMMPTEDFDALASDKKTLEDSIESMENELQNMQDAYAVARRPSEEREEKYRTLIADRDKIKASISKKYTEDADAINFKRQELRGKTAKLKSRNIEISTKIDAAKRGIETRQKVLECLRAEWRRIVSSTPTYGEEISVCPCCHRPFDAETVLAAQNNILADFNEHQAERKRQNNERGKAVSAQIKDTEKEIASLEDERTRNIAAINEITSMPEYNQEFTESYESYLLKDEEYTDISRRIHEMEIEAPVEKKSAVDDSKIVALRIDIQNKRTQLSLVTKQLAKRELIKQYDDRIAELTDRLTVCGQELTNVELKQDALSTLLHLLEQANEENINSHLPQQYRFRTYTQQTNGEIVPDCTLLINGVPYQSANHATQINAGLVIIQAVSANVGVSLPIFCDNAESVNTFHDMSDNQMIYLEVSNDKSLTIKK